MQDPSPEVIQRCRIGDVRALESVYLHYKDYLYRLALNLMGDVHEAEDALHDAFVTVHRDIRQFAARSSFSTWIYRVLTNGCLNRLARRKRLRFLPFSNLKRSPEPVAPSEGNPVAELLDGVSPDFKVCMLLRHAEGLTYDEIAEVLGIPPGTAMSRVGRGTELLRKKFAQEKKGESR